MAFFLSTPAHTDSASGFGSPPSSSSNSSLTASPQTGAKKEQDFDEEDKKVALAFEDGVPPITTTTNGYANGHVEENLLPTPSSTARPLGDTSRIRFPTFNVDFRRVLGLELLSDVDAQSGSPGSSRASESAGSRSSGPSDVTGSRTPSDRDREEEGDDVSTTTALESSRKATRGDRTLSATEGYDDDEIRSVGEETEEEYRFPRVDKGKGRAAEMRDNVDLRDLLSPEPKYVRMEPRIREEEDNKVHHRRKSSGVGVKIQTGHHRRRSSHRGVIIVQEKGFSRDFFLICALCFGMACAIICIVRPAMMVWIRYQGMYEESFLDF